MVTFFFIVAIGITWKSIVVSGYTDLIPEAITVYRNPEFFKNLDYGAKIYYNLKPTPTPEGRQIKYPGETKKPNPRPQVPGYEINYDNSPEFHHGHRDIMKKPYYPSRKKGPYSGKYTDENSSEAKESVQKEAESEEEEEESKEVKEHEESEEEPQDFSSAQEENSEEEFKSYHEPILLARPNFDPASAFTSSTYNKPYSFNRTSPLLYEDWRFYTYPKIAANQHVKSDSHSHIYSEEPSSNYFEDESPSYYTSDGEHEENEDASQSYETNSFKNLGADTKHVYRKLHKPKKSFLFKLHSKPKFKSLKLKFKKKHFHKNDWFNEYPFDF